MSDSENDEENANYGVDEDAPHVKNISGVQKNSTSYMKRST
jgi:hypothetical protein